MKTFNQYIEAVHQTPERIDKYVISCVGEDNSALKVATILDKNNIAVLSYESTDVVNSGHLGKSYYLNTERFFVYIIKCSKQMMNTIYNSIIENVNEYPEPSYTVIYDYYTGHQVQPLQQRRTELFRDMASFADDVIIRYKQKNKRRQ